MQLPFGGQQGGGGGGEERGRGEVRGGGGEGFEENSPEKEWSPRHKKKIIMIFTPLHYIYARMGICPNFDTPPRLNIESYFLKE